MLWKDCRFLAYELAMDFDTLQQGDEEFSFCRMIRIKENQMENVTMKISNTNRNHKSV